MSAGEIKEATPAETFAIGISFGNSNSSIAYTSGVSLELNLDLPDPIPSEDFLTSSRLRKEKQK